MIPPQVNGATVRLQSKKPSDSMRFPMIPPQVNGATMIEFLARLSEAKFPMIPPQVNGATSKQK